MISLFAAEGPHISLKAETIFHIGDFSVTNSMIYGVVISIIITIVLLYAAKNSTVKPTKGLTQFVEMGLEFIISAIEPMLGSREKAAKYTPFFAVFFFFIVMSNLSGLFPVVGEGITVNDIPVFRPFTADINGTIALSAIAIILVQIFSIRESGILGHLKHYFTDAPFNPINFFIGVLEIFGEFTRMASLALRLFLNTTVGEILIAVFAFIGANGSSFTLLPIVTFEVLVALIQAYIFTFLSATYLGLAISHSHDEDHDTEDAHHETAALRPSEATR